MLKLIKTFYVVVNFKKFVVQEERVLQSIVLNSEWLQSVCLVRLFFEKLQNYKYK